MISGRDQPILVLLCTYCQEQGLRREASVLQRFSGMQHGVCSEHAWKIREKKKRKY